MFYYVLLLFCLFCWSPLLIMHPFEIIAHCSMCVCVCVSFVCSHSICMGKGLGWLCPPPRWLLHSTCCRCTLCSGGSLTCLVGVGSAYLYSGITPFAMVSGLPFAPLPSVSLGTTPLLPPTLLLSTSQLPVLPASSRVWACLCHQSPSLHSWSKGFGAATLWRCEICWATILQYFESAANCFPTVSPSSEQPYLRKISSLSLWVYCFLMYLAVLVQDQTALSMPGWLCMRLCAMEGRAGWSLSATGCALDLSL